MFSFSLQSNILDNANPERGLAIKVELNIGLLSYPFHNIPGENTVLDVVRFALQCSLPMVLDKLTILGQDAID